MDLNVDCRLCSRLFDHIQQIKVEYPKYYCKPVPAFGAVDPRLLIVGLAPGKHGANATGIPFTGDAAGIMLYQTLFDHGFSSHPRSTIENKAQLYNCRITNAVKCLPPQNKPLTREINQCNNFLRTELSELAEHSVILALGRIAHTSIIKALGLKQKDFPFAHAAEYWLADRCLLVDSYHCSRYNTQTGRLTEPMFQAVFKRIQVLLDEAPIHA